MEDLNSPLDEQELEEVDRFLAGRVNEDELAEDSDGGMLSVSQLDGLLTAVVSAPVAMPPSQWLPAVWGDFPPEWQSREQAERIITLIMRHMNGIAASLANRPHDFEPLFLERDDGQGRQVIAEAWCDGYMRGVGLSPNDWDSGGQRIRELTQPIMAFTGAAEWAAQNLESEDREQMRERVAANVVAIHQYWRQGDAEDG